MIFYNATTKQGIAQEIDRLCETTDTSYPRLDKTARVNQAMEELVGEIIGADGTWQYDDTNHTTEPIGTGTLVDGQTNYSFASEYLEIEHVDVKDINGNWRRIAPVDRQEMAESTPEEVFGTTAGFPTHYDKVGDTIRLYPAPSSTYTTLSNGIRVTFKRSPQAFTATSATTEDTTEPGLPSSYHVLLAYMAAIPYCMSYKPERVALYEKRRDELKKKLIAFYGRREKDKRKIMSMAYAAHE